MLSTSRLDLFLTPTGKTFVTQADLKELIAAYKELKKIKEQTPVAEFVTLFNTPKGTVEFLGRVPDRKLCDLKEGDLLYKQETIPAQQSPLEYSGGIPFVPWSKEKELFDSIQQSPAVSVNVDMDKLPVWTEAHLSALENDLDRLNRNAPLYPVDASTLVNCCLGLISEVRRLNK